MRACISSAAAMETDDSKSLKNSNCGGSSSSEESEDHESDEGNSILKPFLSGWQRVWGNRKKWFGTGAECQEQPKISHGGGRGGECQTEQVPSSVELQKQQQHQSLRKDPAAVVQTKYRRMSLKHSGGRSTEAAPPRSSQQPQFQPTDDEQRPLSQVHTQVDYTNFLVPCQTAIIHSPYYWGKIDRYEAEALLANRPEGSFLLRDSAQDDFVFSVSFRRYGRSLHARIEEAHHKFSFDCHDPGVHSSSTVQGLLEHYRDPHSCMFFEPLLLYGVPRTNCFSLQSLARSAVCDQMRSYSEVSQLPIPKTLKQYLREYHYKHKIRTRHVDLAS